MGDAGTRKVRTRAKKKAIGKGILLDLRGIG